MSTSTSALVLLAALIAWAALLAPIGTRAIAVHAQTRTETDHWIPATRAAPTHDAEASIETRGSDVLLEDYPLTETTLSTLQRGDRIELPHPDGGTIELRVERADAEHGGRHLMLVQSDGLVSTFTEGGGAFFGTLATPRGVYALEGGVNGSRLTRHTLLDQRMNSHAPDYRNVPAT
jgi:hypothetical protein